MVRKDVRIVASIQRYENIFYGFVVVITDILRIRIADKSTLKRCGILEKD